MADPLAEAFVTIRPDLSGFTAELQRGVGRAIGQARIPGTAGSRLGKEVTGTGFQQQVATSMTTALAGATVASQTQRNLAQQLFGPGFRNETGRALQGALSGVGAGQLAAQFAFFGAGGAALAVLGTGFLSAARSAALLEQQLDVLQAVTGATDEEIRTLAREAERLGASVELPAVTATDAAAAMLELSKAGLSVRDVIGGVEGVLQLSTAANIDAGAAARIAASALNAFSLAGTEAVQVADLLAGASIAAQGDIGDMALALQQSAAVADQAGLSLEQLVTFITLLAKQGILGSDAGTSIRTSLLRLVPTTKEAASFMEVLGIQLDRTRTLGEQLPDLLDQYQVALSALNPTLRQSTLQQIFGTDAIRAATVAIEGGSEAFRTTQFEVDRQNAALELAQAQTKGLAGEVQGLISVSQTLSTNLGQLTVPVLTDLVSGLADTVRAAVALEQAFEDLAAVELPGAGGTVGGFFRTALTLINPVTRELIAFGDAARALAEGDVAALGKSLATALSLPLAVGVTAFDALTEAEKKTAASLLDALHQAEDFRVQLSKIGLPTDEIDQQIKRLRAQLQELRRGPGTIDVDLSDPIDQAIASAEKLKEALADQGLPVAAIQAQINLLRNDLEVGLIRAGRAAALEAKAEAQLARALGLSGSEIARLTATLEEDGRAAGVALGRSFIDGMAGEITASEAEAINAARATLENVRREGEQQVVEAIRSARANLESLGTTLATQLGEIIDLGPIGQKIDELQERLDALQESVSRRQLRFDVSQAEEDLREAQEALASVTKLTPAQRRSQQEFLAPFREKVADAKAAVKEFDLEDAITQQENLRDAAKKAAEEGLQRLVADFEAGRVSADKFETLLSNRLRPALNLIRRRNLGLTLERDFLRDVEALRQQAQALAGFLGVAGTAPGAAVVRPATTQAEVNQRIAEAAASLAQIQKDAKTLSKEEQSKMDIQIGLLRKLIGLLGGGRTATRGGISDASDRSAGR